VDICLLEAFEDVIQLLVVDLHEISINEASALIEYVVVGCSVEFVFLIVMLIRFYGVLDDK